ncbi:PAS domain protein [Treponema primitia ZAS-2]|uniref:Sensory/regulatory protein RpfC n=1 Tax=Treponema primitia (strain ATCC BAA-887 / DSM 12427 / ZAS-2) TaxID=545694 RepID=F5YKM6_TREPZ|nr:ATP-binding protein [Treponema primitia]AEF84402.1 PAS domain protein [Treponema primitia ZAS-2]
MTNEGEQRRIWEKQGKYLSLMLENSPDVILLLDAEGRFLYCSNAFLELAGINDFISIRGRFFDEVYAFFGDPVFLEQSLDRFARVKQGNKTITDTARIDFTGKGYSRSYSINSTPILDEGDNFDGVLVIYHDITELLQAESNDRIKVMFDATPLACTFWDAGGNILDCNQEALKLFDVSTKKELIEGFSRFSVFIQMDGSISNERISREIAETYRTGKRLEFEWMHRSSKGEFIPAEVILVRVAWQDDYRVVAYTRDLRKLKESEDLLHQADERGRELEVETRAAQVASEAKSRFLASMSHEIRTPMNAIIGMSDLMRTDNLDDTQRDFFTDIKKMSKALLQIINDVLDISKIEVGKMELSPVHFNLMELYDNIASMSRFTAQSKDLDFRHSFTSRVPQIIYGDDVRLRQILTNIINNAIKYTRQGYVDFTVDVTAKDGKDYLVFTVKDTGIGIKKEDFPKLFGNFQQLDSDRNRGIVGTGLGLAITKNLVTMMGGEISFESEYGAGSAFTVLLPLVPGDPERIERKGLNAQIKATGDVKVLVVDDNRINLKVALAFLATHDIHAETAESGDEAIAKVSERNYDLVFMDHMMPGMDGIEATKCIRSMEDPWLRKMPIIALTANAVSGARESFLAGGMNDFISKPIDAAELNRKLEKWLPPGKCTWVEIHSSDAKPAAPVSAVESVAVIDRDKAVSDIGGSEELYNQLLLSFRKEHGDDIVKIRTALETGDMPLAHRLAHTLKSTAGLIGAGRLRQLSSEIEKALAEKNPSAAEKLMVQAGAEFAAVLKELDTLIPAGDRKGAGSGGDGAFTEEFPASALIGEPPGRGTLRLKSALQVADPVKIRELAGRLRPLLAAGNAGSLKLIDEIRASFPLKEGGELIQQMQEFEFKRALEILESVDGK